MIQLKSSHWGWWEQFKTIWDYMIHWYPKCCLEKKVILDFLKFKFFLHNPIIFISLRMIGTIHIWIFHREAKEKVIYWMGFNDNQTCFVFVTATIGIFWIVWSIDISKLVRNGLIDFMEFKYFFRIIPSYSSHWGCIGNVDIWTFHREAWVYQGSKSTILTLTWI